MDKEWMRMMLPEKPPAGYEDWILRNAEGDLDLDYMLYSAERVKVYPELKDSMEPKDFEPIKSIWQTRCTCTACGEDFVTTHIKNGFTMYSGPDGCLYPLDPVTYEPEAYSDIEDCGYDSQFIELSDNDTMECPLCCTNVEVLHRSKLRGGRTRQALGCAVQNIANYTAVIFWLTAKRADAEGYSTIDTYPRDAYVIGENGGLTLYRHTTGAASTYSSEHRLKEWTLAQSVSRDSATVPYHNWGSINNRMVGCWTWKHVPYLGGCTGEKTGLEEYIHQGGNYPVTYLKVWRQHRSIENLVKAGWGALIERNISKYTDSNARVLSTEMAGIDFTKKKPHEMLRMTKSDFRAISQKAVWWPDKFEAWADYRIIGGSCSAVEFSKYYGDFGQDGTEALMDLLRVDPKADFPKVAEYLAKQNISPNDDETKQWEGIKLAVVGDSLTDSSINADRKYHQIIAEKTGISVQELAKGGTGYTAGADSGTAYIDRVRIIDIDTDIVTLFGSVNDWKNYENNSLCPEIGSATDQYDDSKTWKENTFCANINHTFDALFERVPTAQVIVFSAMPYYGVGQSHFKDARDALEAVCRERHIPYVDMYDSTGFYRIMDNVSYAKAYTVEGSSATWETTDDYTSSFGHPNNAAHEKIIAPKFMEELKRWIL